MKKKNFDEKAAKLQEQGIKKKKKKKRKKKRCHSIKSGS